MSKHITITTALELPRDDWHFVMDALQLMTRMASERGAKNAEAKAGQIQRRLEAQFKKSQAGHFEFGSSSVEWKEF